MVGPRSGRELAPTERPAVGLADIEAAAQRISGAVRRTPLLAAAPAGRFAEAAANLQLKLENLQVTGSFKARGAANKVLSLPPEEAKLGLVTASGGNHGMAVAWAGGRAGVATTVFLPTRTAAEKAERIAAYGARVVRAGELWDDAHREAVAFAEREGQVYVHAFDDPAVVAGQGTIALEVLAEAPETELLVVAVGGGGLISGIGVAAKALRPDVRIVGVEPEGAPTLHDSLRAGKVVELDDVRDRSAHPRRAPQRRAQLRDRAPHGRGDRPGQRRRDARGGALAVARARSGGRAVGRRGGRRAPLREGLGRARRARLRAGLRRGDRRDRLVAGRLAQLLRLPAHRHQDPVAAARVVEEERTPRAGPARACGTRPA